MQDKQQVRRLRQRQVQKRYGLGICFFIWKEEDDEYASYKDSKTGTWFVKFYCKDWTGENKQIKKRGFVTKREALDYERNYKIRQENNLDMTFGEFWKLYTEDVKKLCQT